MVINDLGKGKKQKKGKKQRKGSKDKGTPATPRAGADEATPAAEPAAEPAADDEPPPWADKETWQKATRQADSELAKQREAYWSERRGGACWEVPLKKNLELMPWLEDGQSCLDDAIAEAMRLGRIALIIDESKGGVDALYAERGAEVIDAKAMEAEHTAEGDSHLPVVMKQVRGTRPPPPRAHPPHHARVRIGRRAST